MAHVSQDKAKTILKHGEVRGHPLTKAQMGYFGSRAGGLPERNAPIFPLPSDEGMEGLIPQEREPLLGPAGSFAGNPTSEFGGRTGHAFDGTDAFVVKAPHPSAPLNDSDFPSDATFDHGTAGHLTTGGVT